MHSMPSSALSTMHSTLSVCPGSVRTHSADTIDPTLHIGRGIWAACIHAPGSMHWPAANTSAQCILVACARLTGAQVAPMHCMG